MNSNIILFLFENIFNYHFLIQVLGIVHNTTTQMHIAFSIYCYLFLSDLKQ